MDAMRPAKSPSPTTSWDPSPASPALSPLATRAINRPIACDRQNLFYFCLGRDQLSTFRGRDRQPYLFAAAAGRNCRGNAISVLRVGFHAVVEQYRVAAFQCHAQRRGRFDTEELKIHARTLGREIDQDVLVGMSHVPHADGLAAS